MKTTQTYRDLVVYENIWQKQNILQEKNGDSRPSTAVIEMLDELASISPETRLPIADLGCGAGRHLSACRLGGYEVYGIDYSSAALLASSNLLSKSSQNCSTKYHLIQADCFQWIAERESNSFHAVICHDSIHHNCPSEDALRARVANIFNSVVDNGFVALTILSDIEYSASDVPSDRLRLCAGHAEAIMDSFSDGIPRCQTSCRTA